MRRIAGVLLLGLTSACAVAETVQVHVADYKFAPEEIRIKAGDTVRWINDEKRTSHSVRFLVQGVAESERFFPGETWERTFDQAGRFEYSCGPHPEMHGVVIVE